MEFKRTSVSELIQIAKEESFAFHRDVIDTEHILLAMMKTGGMETVALTRAGANYNTLQRIARNNSKEGIAIEKPDHTSNEVRQLIRIAQGISQQNGETEVFAEYILLALLNDRTSFASTMLAVADINKQVIYKHLMDMLHQKKHQDKETNLSKYGTNLNKKAEDGKIDPVIGRDKEIERMVQILSRRTKNNPVLIGDPGVGKTAIAEGLAQRIVVGEVPDIIKNKTIYSIDMATMVAGTKYRGDFEQRLNDTIKELIEKDDVIVFIDELHTIIGAGSAEGTLDASNILKPALAKGKLQLIGATTIDEYRKKIEKDAALERRFQPVMVEEPSKEETLQILSGLRAKYEAFHHVRISDEAIQAAVGLTSRYLTDRFLPDKAIDVVDEALARIRVNTFSVSKEQLNMEEKREALEKEKNQAALTQDFERAAKIRDELSEVNKKYNEYITAKENSDESWPSVGFDEIAGIVSQWSGVPVNRLTESESSKYINMPKLLKKKVIGQDYAIDTVSAALKRARVGLKGENHPIGTFIFVGPTGVGKTYLSKKIAENLFGDESSLIRIDMSEYMEKYSVSRLVGAAPGYIGYDEGGQLTEMVRSKPYSVVLFDEIEKAHPDVFNILLQVLDDGRLTDSKGRTVDFRNTVIIMTSNVGTSKIGKEKHIGFGNKENVEKDEYENMKEIIHQDLAKTFRPEFLNRLDDIVVFNRLNEKSIQHIADILLNELIQRVDALGYRMTYDKSVVKKLAADGYKPEFGARPLEREIRIKLEDTLADKMLSGEMKKDKDYLITLKDNEMVIEESALIGKLTKRNEDGEKISVCMQ